MDEDADIKVTFGPTNTTYQTQIESLCGTLAALIVATAERQNLSREYLLNIALDIIVRDVDDAETDSPKH